MTISELAKACGVGIETLRFYERRKLIADPRKRGMGCRNYSDDAVRRVKFIKQAQTLGFTLKEIAELLELRVSPTTTCDDVRGLAESKLTDIAEKVRTLKTLERALKRLVKQCNDVSAATGCPILDALDSEAEASGQCSSTGRSGIAGALDD